MPGWGACEPSKRNCRFEDFSQTRTFGTDVLRAWREPGLTPCCGRVESAPRRAYIKNSEGESPQLTTEYLFQRGSPAENGFARRDQGRDEVSTEQAREQ